MSQQELNSPSASVSSAKNSFPARVLALSLLLTALTLCWLSYCAVSTYRNVATASSRYARASDLRGTIVHLDEVLTMSAKMAAATGDLAWEKRYRAHEGKLDDAIKAALKELPPSAAQTRQLDEANLRLVAMENSAFDEVRGGHAERARLILETPLYAQQKRIYAVAISRYLDGARDEQRAILESQKILSAWALVAAIVGMLGLSASWIVSARELTRWRNAQDAEIAARRQANRELKAQSAQLQNSEARYLRMASNVPGMVYQFVLKPDGDIEMPFASEGAREIYGVDPEAIRANPQLILDAVIAQDRASIDESIAQSARDMAPWQWDGRMEMADGTRKWVSGTSRPEKRENGEIVWDGVLLDITARKSHEVELDRARQEAEAANRAKSEFLGRMSHELRTPLNAILGFGQLLEVEELEQSQSESVAQILIAGRHLLGLINEVLDIARIESGQQGLNLEHIDIAQIARETCEMVRPLAQQNSIALEMCFASDCCMPLAHPPQKVIADAQRTKQVLINLLSNAVKYAGDGATINLCCEPLNGDSSVPLMALSVSDNGPGIAPELQERVWIPFDRIGAEASTIEGAGIGLPLARTLAEAMGGTLELQSAVGQGCTFTLTLPCAVTDETVPIAPTLERVMTAQNVSVVPLTF